MDRFVKYVVKLFDIAVTTTVSPLLFSTCYLVCYSTLQIVGIRVAHWIKGLICRYQAHFRRVCVIILLLLLVFFILSQTCLNLPSVANRHVCPGLECF